MKIMCATDFSEAGLAAENQALSLSCALGAELVYVHVNQEAPLWGDSPLGMADLARVYEAERQWASKTLEERVSVAQARGLGSRWMLRSGVAHVEIVAACEADRPDMLVIGTHGRSGLDRLLMGSVAERVVRTAPCPVLTVRPHPTEQRAAA